MKLETDFIEKLAEIIKTNELTEIILEDGEQAITLRKEVVVASTPVVAAQPVVSAPAASSAPATAVTPAIDAPKGKAITSPMVGTFYAAPAPDAKPFVEVGGSVNEGDVVCVIEAMKLMNEIKSEYTGKISKICVKNGDPIEFGQVLMYVE